MVRITGSWAFHWTAVRAEGAMFMGMGGHGTWGEKKKDTGVKKLSHGHWLAGLVTGLGIG